MLESVLMYIQTVDKLPTFTPGGITKSCTFCISYFDFGMLRIFAPKVQDGDALRKTSKITDYVKSK